LADVICDTSPLQYLHQVSLLHILPALATRVIIPPAVQNEIEVGKAHGVDLPALEELSWLEVRLPQTAAAVPLITDLGKGEIQVLMLALEDNKAVAVLDDGLARRVAEMLEIQYTGTIGLLLDAKEADLIPAVKPVLEKLDSLRFRLAADTRVAVLRLAGEL
jgi:uncharacterized protein